MIKLPFTIKSLCLFIVFLSMMSVLGIQKSFSQTKPAWTPETEKEVYTLLYDQSQQLLVKDEQRKAWAECAVQHLKVALPQGMGSVPQDSISRLAQSIGASCTLTIKDALFTWSPLMIQTIKQQLAARPELQNMTADIKAQLADCLLVKYQKQFPNGFTIAMIGSAAEKYVKECMAEINTKKP